MIAEAGESSSVEFETSQTGRAFTTRDRRLHPPRSSSLESPQTSMNSAASSPGTTVEIEAVRGWLGNVSLK